MNILGLNIENSSYNEILAQIESQITSRVTFSFSYVNAHISLTAQRNSEFFADTVHFSALYPDGVGIYWASKFLYGKNGLCERINGTDLYYKVLVLAEKNGYKVFFFGGDEKHIVSLEARLKSLYPNLNISGIVARDLSFSKKILEKLNQSDSDILFLGLGTPYQEKWVATLGKKCNIPIQVSVGSGIDFLSGAYKRAPKLFRILGFEWLFRLLVEPKRLWKRYLVGIPTFIFLIIKQKIFGKNQL
jgi:N-acetylglucosaminyldiphosphoundecaprenol N-acetyl-beta-D-mannosaminyltransferase